MRFIAKFGKYAVQVRPQVVEAYATGGVKIVQTQLKAEFSIHIATPEERALARQMWTFNGFYQEEDWVTIVEPDYRISAFDSILAQAELGWTDEEREQVEQTLTEIARKIPGDVIRVEQKRAVPPWPTYDHFPGTRADLLKKIADDGFDLAQVLVYERENQNRDEIVAFMEAALEDEIPESAYLAEEEELVG